MLDDPLSPVLAVRLQEMFGLTATPLVGGGRVPLTLHLLSPAGRPMQVTRDLDNAGTGTMARLDRFIKGDALLTFEVPLLRLFAGAWDEFGADDPDPVLKAAIEALAR